MAYNQTGYGQQGQQGYNQYNPYGGQGNPYGQQQNPYAQQEQPYGHTGNYSERPDLEHQSSSVYDEHSQRGSNYEMSNMNGRDPNRILNEVRLIDAELDKLEGELQRLRGLQNQFLDSPDSSRESVLGRQVDNTTNDILATYSALTSRVNRLKRDPESGNPRNKAQVGKIDRRLKTSINQAQRVDRDYKVEGDKQIARQYRIVRPDASDAEVQEAVENGVNQQLFSANLMSSDRQGHAREALGSVTNRHQAMQKLEKDMMTLAQLFNDLEALVVQQEPAVAQIEENGNKTTEHVTHANTELDVAVKSAKAARRKKFYCLGIALLIIIIIVVVVVVVVEVTKK